MTLFLTVDNDFGVAFNRRRQSRDSAVVCDIASSACSVIRMTAYSAKLFGDIQQVLVTDDIFLPKTDGFVFCECVDAAKHFDIFDTIVLYKWNRDYPHDIVLSKTPMQCGFVLESTTEFVGSSHDNITKEVWIKHNEQK